ncbi:MAG: hypothetical protein MUD12_12215 [Spirochaetes bacterium]|jgi:hypothetical protein|nr:hypothetical protein [Spirochaetota bacterium]
MIKTSNDITTNKFVRLIEENHQEIIEYFMNDIIKNKKTTAYRNLDSQKLYEIGSRVYRELSRWVTKELTKEEVKEYYFKLSKVRITQGIPAAQVFQAQVLLKRHMWLFIMKHLGNDITDYKQVVDLINRVIVFFDRAAYYTLAGYEEELNKKF